MNDDLLFRMATLEDLPRIIELLAADQLGATRERCEHPLPECYVAALRAISDDPNNELLVACLNDRVVGVLQLTFIPYLTHQGSWRALIEGVRVSYEARGQGLGERMMRHAIARARNRGCRIIQLTSDKSRHDAIRFYQRLGFVDSHEGFKLMLEPAPTMPPAGL